MALAAGAERYMIHFTSQILVNTARAFATVVHQVERLFMTLAAAAERCTMDFTSQNLANTAWEHATVSHKDLATVGQHDVLLFNAVAMMAIWRLDNFSALAFANMA